MKASSSSAVEKEQHREHRRCFCVPGCHSFFDHFIKAGRNCLGLDGYSTAQYDRIVLMSDPPPVIEREIKCSEDEGTSSGTGRELRTRVKKPIVGSGHGVQINSNST